MALARAVSIAVHPALVMPAVVFLGVSRNVPLRAAAPAVLSAVAVAAAVMIYSAVQVRMGRWAHVDASVREERQELNLFLAIVLALVASALWLTGRPWGVVAGVASAATLVGVAHAARRQLKISLHVAFAAFGAAFLWPRAGAMGLMLGLAVAVGWSRLVLGRHEPREVMAGGVLGIAVGVLFLAVR